jgi:hypothetical protein
MRCWRSQFIKLFSQCSLIHFIYFIHLLHHSLLYQTSRWKFHWGITRGLRNCGVDWIWKYWVEQTWKWSDLFVDGLRRWGKSLFQSASNFFWIFVVKFWLSDVNVSRRSERIRLIWNRFWVNFGIFEIWDSFIGLIIKFGWRFGRSRIRSSLTVFVFGTLDFWDLNQVEKFWDLSAQ